MHVTKSYVPLFRVNVILLVFFFRDAWNKLGNMDREVAMLNYVEELKKVLPTYMMNEIFYPACLSAPLFIERHRNFNGTLFIPAWKPLHAFKWALFFLLFPTFLICSYFSLLFHDNALLFLLFHSKMTFTCKNLEIYPRSLRSLEFIY